MYLVAGWFCRNAWTIIFWGPDDQQSQSKVRIEKKKTEPMEAVIFALIDTRKEPFVPESAEFELFDLRALRRSYNAEDNSPSRPFNRKKSFLFTRHTVPVMLQQKQGTILMISSMAGVYGFGGEAVYCATKFAQVGFAQALDKELRVHGIKVGVICPGGVKTEFALGRGRTQEGVSNSDMLEPEDVAGAVLLACKQSPGSRIIEIQMRTMAESLV